MFSVDVHSLWSDDENGPSIQTAFIERVNLTIRQCISLLTRRTWSTARSDTNLLAHLEWWRAYYHFGRTHQALRVPMPGFRHKFRPRTPALALGLTDHVWSVTDRSSPPRCSLRFQRSPKLLG